MNVNSVIVSEQLLLALASLPVEGYFPQSMQGDVTLGDTLYSCLGVTNTQAYEEHRKRNNRSLWSGNYNVRIILKHELNI